MENFTFEMRTKLCYYSTLDNACFDSCSSTGRGGVAERGRGMVVGNRGTVIGTARPQRQIGEKVEEKHRTQRLKVKTILMLSLSFVEKLSFRRLKFCRALMRGLFLIQSECFAAPIIPLHSTQQSVRATNSGINRYWVVFIVGQNLCTVLPYNLECENIF